MSVPQVVRRDHLGDGKSFSGSSLTLTKWGPEHNPEYKLTISEDSAAAVQLLYQGHILSKAQEIFEAALDAYDGRRWEAGFLVGRSPLKKLFKTYPLNY